MNNRIYPVKSYHKGHPDPTKYREDYELLNGEWDFAFDENDEGLLKHYEKNFPKGRKIIVPYPYQSKASGICLPDKQCDVIWYEREFIVDDPEKTYIITFQAVDYKTAVFINGEYVLTHEGGYDGFCVDATPFVSSGKNKITLRVEDTMSIDQVRGKQRWRKNSFTCFYTETSGIVKDVYMERLSKKHIEEFTLKGDYETKTLSICVSAPVDTTLAVALSDSDGKFVKRQKFLITANEEELAMQLNVVTGWSCENPYLYNVELSLFDGDKKTDNILSYCGFVTVSLDNGRILINGKDTYLKFVLNQGYWTDTISSPTEDEILRDVELTLACGFNGARMHEHVPSPLNFYYMDLYGLYAFQECPSAYGYSYKSQKQYFKQFPRLIREHLSHPCIIAYVLWNESWGINEIKESAEIQQMTADMYALVKSMVSDRLVISNDGWEHTVSDIITFHNYAESYDELHSFLDGNVQRMMAGENAECVQNVKDFFVGNYRYTGQAIMLSEFAGIAFAKDDSIGWGYGKSVGTEKDFLKKYGEMLDFIYGQKELCGFCMTQLTDVYQEKNGIFSMDRSEKVSVEAIKKLHGRRDETCKR